MYTNAFRRGSTRRFIKKRKKDPHTHNRIHTHQHSPMHNLLSWYAQAYPCTNLAHICRVRMKIFSVFHIVKKKREKFHPYLCHCYLKQHPLLGHSQLHLPLRTKFMSALPLSPPPSPRAHTHTPLPYSL